jgi:endoglucanase
MARKKSHAKTKNALPRWRGFNLPDMMGFKSRNRFREEDFRLVAELGFDFVRLPLCYRNWVKKPADPDDLMSVNEKALKPIDQAVEWGRKHGLHVCINFHRAPGYSVNSDWNETRCLWKSEKPLPAFKFHWATFARRYRAISPKHLSFNLVNEPPRARPQPPGDPKAWVMTRGDHERVMRETVAAIRAVDPDRLIILDGVDYANRPCPEMADLAPGVAQSCRAYWPSGISHWRAGWWKGSDAWPRPTWPGALHEGKPWDRKRLETHYAPWIKLARRGVGVHCGEGGSYNRTPHAVVLAWLRDALEILTAADIGYALWNFRGSFGILDSERADVKYQDWRGHKLDRKLLNLLKEF